MTANERDESQPKPDHEVRFVVYQKAYPCGTANLCFEVYDRDGQQIYSKITPAPGKRPLTIGMLSAMLRCHADEMLRLAERRMQISPR